MALPTSTPEANYLARNNIVLPSHIVAAEVTAMEVRARAEIGARSGTSAPATGSIRKSKD